MKKIITLLPLALLVGCAGQPKSLYSWNNYEREIYASLQDEGQDSFADQISRLEKDLEKAHQKDQKIPPGFYAHLGMLYAKVGAKEQMQECFNKEKQLFPESAHYLDVLMTSKITKSSEESASKANAKTTTQSKLTTKKGTV